MEWRGALTTALSPMTENRKVEARKPCIIPTISLLSSSATPHASTSSNALASCKSAVSKPSVNQP